MGPVGLGPSLIHSTSCRERSVQAAALQDTIDAAQAEVRELEACLVARWVPTTRRFITAPQFGPPLSGSELKKSGYPLGQCRVCL